MAADVASTIQRLLTPVNGNTSGSTENAIKFDETYLMELTNILKPIISRSDDLENARENVERVAAPVVSKRRKKKATAPEAEEVYSMNDTLLLQKQVHHFTFLLYIFSSLWPCSIRLLPILQRH